MARDEGLEQGWIWGTHYMPHDIRVHEWTDGLTRIEHMQREVAKRRLGRVAKVPNHHVEDGIDATRRLLGICQFDAGPCAEGIKCLKNYRKGWDGELGVWKDRPRHDAASHGADAFRALAMTYRDIPVEAKVPDGAYDVQGRLIPTGPRKFKVLSELTYDEFFELSDLVTTSSATKAFWSSPRKPQDGRYSEGYPGVGPRGASTAPWLCMISFEKLWG